MEEVNITPVHMVIRGSRDWDDQPGKDTASELSLENAIDYALRFARVKMCPQEKVQQKQQRLLWRQ